MKPYCVTIHLQTVKQFEVALTFGTFSDNSN